MMKKSMWKAVCVIAIMTAGMLLGCSKEEKKENRNNELVWAIGVPMQPSEEEAKTLKQIWEKPLNELLKENKMEYSVRLEMLIPDEEHTFAEILEERKEKNIPTDIISAVGTMINSNEVEKPYWECAEAGLLLSLEEFYKTDQGKNTAKEIRERDLESAKIEGIPYGIGVTIPWVNAVGYSRTIMQECGISEEQISSNLFENEEIMLAVKEKTGKAPYHLSNADIRYQLGMWVEGSAFGLWGLALGNNGQFINILETDEFAAYMEKLISWKEKGILEVGYVLEDEPFAISLLDQGIYNSNMDRYDAEWEITVGEEAETKIMKGYVVPDSENGIIQPYQGDAKTGISSWTKQKQESWDFLEQLFTNSEIANLIQYGTEGKEYELKNGMAERTQAKSLYLELIGANYTNQLISYPSMFTANDKRKFAEQYDRKVGNDIPYGFRFQEDKVQEELEKIENVIGLGGNGSQEFQDLLTLNVTSENLGEKIDKLNRDLRENGMDRIVQEANRQLKAWSETVEKRGEQ